jgi:hypothetical protein
VNQEPSSLSPAKLANVELQQSSRSQSDMASYKYFILPAMILAVGCVGQDHTVACSPMALLCRIYQNNASCIFAMSGADVNLQVAML